MKSVYCFFLLFLILTNCKFYKVNENINLNGEWKITDYELPGISAVGEDEVKANIGTFVRISNRNMVIQLLGKNFSCEIIELSKQLINVNDYELFKRDEKGSMNPKRFKLSSKGFIFKTQKNKNVKYDLRNIYVDGEGDKIIINWDGAVFLLEREKKPKERN